MRNLITKRPWLVAMSAMTVALMAVTFMVATSLAGQVQAAPDANDEGMVTGNMTVFTNAVDQDWTAIDGLSGTMHKASQKDLVIDVSLECSLYTLTEVKDKGGKGDSSMADASVQVRVMITPSDVEKGPYFLPGDVTFCRRSQTLSAEFQGLLTNEDGTVCLSVDPETLVVTIDEECLEFESVKLIMDTTNANAFNFVYRDLPQGDYYVEVQAKISTDTAKTNGSASATATIGKGSAILEEVRFAKTTS